jgi:metal-responsive CopG/Arc/MetJ family transcriptional regulator
MKTAISIPDPIFREAEEAARRLGISRSELFTRAMVKYLGKINQGSTTEALNRIYTEEDSRVAASLEAMQSASINQDEW